jgi:virginiamycin B lyase
MKKIVLLAGVIIMALTGCSLHGAAPSAGAFGYARAVQDVSADPGVIQSGNGSHWQQFTPRLLGATLFVGLTVGPDGNMWFIDENTGGIVRINDAGEAKEFSLNGALGNSGYDMVVGADKLFYITSGSTNIVRANTSGKTKTFKIPGGDFTQLEGMALGPDGNVWFAEFNHIAKITTNGVITQFAYPTQPNTNQYGGVASGPGGDVWFGESSINAIGKIVPATGKITEIPLTQQCGPGGLVEAKDGNIWFGCLVTGGLVGKITPSGAQTFYTTGYAMSGNYTLQFVTRGPDGNPWFATADGGVIFEVSTKTGAITSYTPPTSPEYPNTVATGPDGNVWVITIRTGHVLAYIPNPLSVTPRSLKFTSLGQAKDLNVVQHGTSSWTATSSDATIATVAPMGASKFVVTSAGVGKCKITIADAVGNFVKVAVVVQ